MGQRSGCLIFLLVVILLINILGFYFYIDSNSRYTMALAENTETLHQLHQTLDKISSKLANQQTLNLISNGKNQKISKINFANSQYRPDDAQSGGKMIKAINSFSGNLNKLVRTEATTSAINNKCNDLLANRNLMKPTEFEPVLAEDWSISSDGLTYTIKIKENVTWHPYIDPVTNKKVPSKEVTADDFIFYWETINNQDIPCEAIRTYFKLVKDIVKIDKYSFKVIWKEPYSLAKGITLSISPLPKHYYRPNPDWDDKEFAAQMRTSKRNQFLVGCGPYYLDNWKKGQSLTLKRYENYYGLKPYIKEIIYKVIPEPNVQLIELKKGGIDIMGLSTEQWIKETDSAEFITVTPDIKTAIRDSAEWNRLKNRGETPKNYSLEKYQYQSAAVSWMFIAYNLDLPIFQDKKVRQALTMLTDRERILREVRNNFGKIMAGPFNDSSPFYDPAVKPLPFAPEEAAKLLAQAGWEDTDKDGILDKDTNNDGTREPFSFSLMIPNSVPTYRKFGAIIQADLKKSGIEMNLAPLEWSVFVDKLNNRSFQSCSLGWTGTINPDPYQIWHSSQAEKKNSSNFISFKNNKADKLIEKGRRTIDLEERTKIFREFYRLLHEEQPYTFLFSAVSLRAQNKKFFNSRVYKLGMDDNLMWIPQMTDK